METYIAYNCTALLDMERQLEKLKCSDIQNLNDGESFRFTCSKNTFDQVLDYIKQKDMRNKNVYIRRGQIVVYDSKKDIKENIIKKLIKKIIKEELLKVKQ